MVYIGYQKVRLGSNAYGECFLVNTISSRSNEPSRDRGATRERNTMNNVDWYYRDRIYMTLYYMTVYFNVFSVTLVRLSDRDIATTIMLPVGTFIYSLLYNMGVVNQ